MRNYVLLRGPDISGLEADLAKVRQHLQRVEVDDIFSPAERKLEKIYYTRWRKQLERSLAYERGVKLPKQAADDEAIGLGDDKSSDESWRAITPRPLLRAVMKIREDCERLCDAQRDHFAKMCFKELHPVASGTSAPAIFVSHSGQCIEKTREITKHTFGRFLDIALNQNGIILEASVQWASLQTVDLIEREDRLVEDWIKSVCDKRSDVSSRNNQEFMDKVVFRTDWRAPAWLGMQPNANRPYDASIAWERMNESDTKSILKYLREGRWIILLKSTLDQLVGLSHEVLAKRKTAATGNPVSGVKDPGTKTPDMSQRADSNRALLLKYRSGIKRAILLALSKNPKATDADVCRSLDADGGEELPTGWRSRTEDRSFFKAYRAPKTKRRIEIAISKIRSDLRDRGLL